jgi:hypothetical protein
MAEKHERFDRSFPARVRLEARCGLSSAPSELVYFPRFTHGLRRGLYFCAASRLETHLHLFLSAHSSYDTASIFGIHYSAQWEADVKP